MDGAASVPANSTPVDEQLLFADAFEALMGDLRAEERQIIELRLAGETQVAIAQTLGRSERTIRRVMTALEARLTAALAPPSS
jgi:DNA-binding NarL/FixJ family response regulator